MTDSEDQKKAVEESLEPSSGEQKSVQSESKVLSSEQNIRCPIIEERKVGRFEFLYRRPAVSARVARVFVTSSGRCVEYRPDKQPTTGELVWGGIRTVYEVDLGVHLAQIEASPPSDGDRVSFAATADLLWRVTDPTKVVLAGIDDVRKAISPSLLSRLRGVTRQYDIGDAEKAEVAANDEFADNNLGAEFGLAAQVFIRLAMDDSSLQNAAIGRKSDFFRAIMAAGDYNEFALQLALKPDDISAVVQLLVDERESHRKALFEFVTSLLESDALDRWQIDDQVRITLQWLRDSGSKVLAGSESFRQGGDGMGRS